MSRFVPGLAAATLLTFAHPGAVAAQSVHRSGAIYHREVCGPPAKALSARCHAHVVTDALGVPVESTVTHHTAPRGYAPLDLRAAYNVGSNGSAQTTIAVVEAFGSNTAEADLAVYRSTFGLSPCASSNGCYTQVGQNGGAIDKSAHGTLGLSWAMETELDLEMASAMCPNCKLLLVEANSDSYADLGDAVNTAVNLGAHVVTNSYGGDEAGTLPFAANYDHPGVALVVSAGDSGYDVQFPAASPFVTAVGGTTLTAAPNTRRGWSETTWAGTGSGCSALFFKPAWQTDPSCAMRTVADVSAVADPAPGVAVYAPTAHNQSAWQVFGGTSVAASVIAGLYGANGGPVTYGKDPYVAGLRGFNDVTSGGNGTCAIAYFCTAAPGYDGPTGLGTPISEAVF
jgi:subtilase family serine protease